MKKILIVDDEEQILKALSRLFFETDYAITTTSSSLDALQILDQGDTDLIISDMKMPLMDGYELLRTVKEKYPDIIRISLSGYAEENAMFKATLHNIAVYNVFKPWNNKNFIELIDKIFATHSLLKTDELDRLASEKDLLPVIPATCQKMLSIIEQEDEDALLSELENSSELSSLLMQSANCSIYGAMPASMKQTALYIGIHNMKCFLYWATMTITANHPYKENNDMGVLWKHGCYTNKIFLFIYEAFLHKQPPEAAFLAGLLHNTGQMLLMQNKNGIYEGLAPLSGDDLLSKETEKLNATHQEIGGYALHKWDMPFSVVEVALYHHEPDNHNIVNKELVSSVHIAQHYAWKVIKEEAKTRLYTDVFAQIDTTKDKFEQILSRYLKMEIESVTVQS